ncbi:DUF883 family protein [Henriciella algicola]|uniref:DUF883 family protein n=1 Tax=Henriciella algicola TaxID=1608422 RepID=A0A399RSG5_9PROT|nr:DUF883 family protein [Henriciella algicola]RIJ33224.1 DUF883 family protein [Henriciella algicola]
MAGRTATKANGVKDVAAEAAAKAAGSDFESLKGDIAQLQKDLQSLASNSGKYIRERTSKEYDRGVKVSKDYATKAGDEAEKARDYIEDKVRENPLASIGIAFGTGVLLAMLKRK